MAEELPRQTNSGRLHRTPAPVHAPMVRWYEPLLLLRTGLRALLATVVGQIADNRALQVADYRGAAKPIDYSANQELWLDYVADVGDGWDATYSVASALARPEITYAQADTELPRSDVLIFGGDAVYPDPSQCAYLERTFAPYQQACAAHDEFNADCFAVPGNHDWYDGLHAFEDLFCHDEADDPQWPLGNWRKRQRQSYFALHLPAGWRLVAPDVQLDGRLNHAQRAFFRGLIQTFDAGDQVILCASQPGWVVREPAQHTRLLRWFDACCKQAGASLRLVLTGDQHHYSRYVADDGPVLLTAGGGGSFLHSTHRLPEVVALPRFATDAECATTVQTELDLPEGSDQGAADHMRYQCAATYPERRVSRQLSRRNLLFPIVNWELSLVIGCIYTLLAWMIETRSLLGDETLSVMFERMLTNHVGIADVLARLFATLPKSPEFALLVLLTGVGLTVFNSNCSRATAALLGALHTLLHLLGLVLTYCVAVEVTTWLHLQLATLSFSFLWFLIVMVIFGGGVGGIVFGAYLWLSLNVFGVNLTNAFSSLRIAKYRNFLRLHIAADGTLTVFPLGIEHPQGEDSVVVPIDRPVRL